jgi:tRNA (guanine37-N1)-methyltransferase
MSPDVWGETLDPLVKEGTLLIVPTPAGALFTQETAQSLATEEHLVFACGRYEGIDQRVVEHYGRKVTVLELSIGDYVLNGGEVAVLAMLEAIVRLVPGFMGNPDSLAEESHESGLLEYPSFTKPRQWRGLDVPEVLLSGNHEAIRAWRQEQSYSRTKAIRPELLRD